MVTNNHLISTMFDISKELQYLEVNIEFQYTQYKDEVLQHFKCLLYHGSDAMASQEFAKTIKKNTLSLNPYQVYISNFLIQNFLQIQVCSPYIQEAVLLNKFWVGITGLRSYIMTMFN
jgi:hypothetical protein